MINIGVIGCGYWGPNLIRNFAKNHDCHIKWLCDLNKSKLAALKKNYASSNLIAHSSSVINDPQTDAVIVATPLYTHYDIVKKSLLAGKHVFVEKPFVDSSKKARELTALAEKKKLVLMAGYTYVYSPAIQKIKQTIETGGLGSIYYINSVRVNFGIFRKKESVIWDLAVHDFSIISYWFNETPQSVMCAGRDSLKRGYVDTAAISVKFKSGLTVYILVSWLSPIKMRNMIITGSKKMMFFNDERGTEKIKIYNQFTKLKDVIFSGEYQPVYNRSSVFSPWLDATESIENEVNHFLNCIKNGQRPITDGAMGIKVVKLLEATEKSLKLNKQVPVYK